MKCGNACTRKAEAIESYTDLPKLYQPKGRSLSLRINSRILQQLLIDNSLGGYLLIKGYKMSEVLLQLTEGEMASLDSPIGHRLRILKLIKDTNTPEHKAKRL